MKKYCLLVVPIIWFQLMVVSAHAVEDNQESTSVLNASASGNEPTTGTKLVWVPRGCFELGTNATEAEEPVHTVCVNGYRMVRNEATQKEYQQVIDTSPSVFKATNHPVMARQRR